MKEREGECAHPDVNSKLFSRPAVCGFSNYYFFAFHKKRHLLIPSKMPRGGLMRVNMSAQSVLNVYLPVIMGSR